MPVLPNERPVFRPRMGKNAGFAQRRAVFPAAEGQKRLFCPTKGLIFVFGWANTPVLPNEKLYFRLRDPKMACFGVRRGVFPGSGAQKGLFWGTEVGGEGGGRRRTGQRGTGASGRPEKGHQGKGASGKRGTAAGIYARRRLRRGRCGGLWGRPSSRPAVA